MFDTVKVAPESFRSIEFRSAGPRREFVEDSSVADDAKPQKRTRDGVPVWTVKVLAEDWRGREDISISVTVPMHGNPADKFERGQLIQLVGLTFGVTPKRGGGGGFFTWYSADDLAPASGPAA